jgi:TusA-related sulfurtransferase
MSESKVVDARGLSCPMPVMLARKALLEAGNGTVEVRVDNETPRDNVARLAEREGWKVEIRGRTGGEFLLVLTR